MLHAVVDRVRARLLDRLPPTRSYTLNALGQAGLPGPIAHFIAQMLQRRLENEVQAISDVRTHWFDHAHADVQEAYETYVETLSEHAQVPVEEWERTLGQAVEQVVPFLVQPARTLGAFVFPEGRDVLPAAVVLRRMRYFNAYPYLNEVVAAYVQRKKLDEVDRATFVPLLHRIEHRTPDEYTPAGWVALLKPLYYAVGEGTPAQVEAALLARFFEDKGLREIAGALRERAEPLSADALEALLADVAAAAVAPPAVPEPEAVPEPPPLSAPAAARAAPRLVAAEAPAAPIPPPPSPTPAPRPAPPAPQPEEVSPLPGADGAVPLWQRYQRQAPGPAVPPRPPAPTAAPPAASPTVAERARERSGAPLWARFRGSEAAAPEPGAEPDTLDRLEQDVLGAGARAQRPQFVRVLFSGSTDAYRSLLESLRGVRTWAEASRLIAASFRQHHVNIYQESAVAFTDLAEARYG